MCLIGEFLSWKSVGILDMLKKPYISGKIIFNTSLYKCVPLEKQVDGQLNYVYTGNRRIAPTQDCTHEIKKRFYDAYFMLF